MQNLSPEDQQVLNSSLESVDKQEVESSVKSLLLGIELINVVGVDVLTIASMVFTKRLREGVRRGEITCSVRIWIRPRVKVGARYVMEEGEIEIDSVEPIELSQVTPELARESGFLGLADLLNVARHGKGENMYLIRFHYLHSLKEPSLARRESPKKQR